MTACPAEILVKIPFWSMVVYEFSNTIVLSSEFVSSRVSATIKNLVPSLFCYLISTPIIFLGSSFLLFWMLVILEFGLLMKLKTTIPKIKQIIKKAKVNLVLIIFILK